MGEFDDIVTQLQLVKNRMLELGEYPDVKPLKADAYHYLVGNILFSAFNKEKLRARVREVYFDLVQCDETPDIYSITDAIDEENMAIIYEFYKQLYLKADDIENIIAHYVHDISCMLDDWVEEILKADGYAFKGISLMKVFQQHHDKVNSLTDGEGQNIINPEWL